MDGELVFKNAATTAAYSWIWVWNEYRPPVDDAPLIDGVPEWTGRIYAARREASNEKKLQEWQHTQRQGQRQQGEQHSHKHFSANVDNVFVESTYTIIFMPGQGFTPLKPPSGSWTTCGIRVVANLHARRRFRSVIQRESIDGQQVRL